MSIYSKQLDLLEYSDIQQLLIDKAKENIRLEFKEVNDIENQKDNIIKKISSLANTYGGHIILGIKEKDGFANDLPGVKLINGFDQKITQWCFDEIYPPITPFVSSFIPKPDIEDKGFYVLYIPESSEAPHFLNKLGGCYIRTGEYSQKLEEKLAKFDEIQHLANRRQLSVDLREERINRAKRRFATHAGSYNSQGTKIGNLDLFIWSSIIPLYPVHDSFALLNIEKAIGKAKINIPFNNYPYGIFRSQNNGFYCINPSRISFSYLELDSLGLIFNAEELGHVDNNKDTRPSEINKTQPKPEEVYIYDIWLMESVLKILIYAQSIYKLIGYTGLVLARFGLENIWKRKLRITHKEYLHSNIVKSSILDDCMSVDKIFSSTELNSKLIPILIGIYKDLTFACGWEIAYSISEQSLNSQVDEALKRINKNRNDLIQ
jgi:hypothetical protein